jgi:hypothetical protein
MSNTVGVLAIAAVASMLVAGMERRANPAPTTFEHRWEMATHAPAYAAADLPGVILAAPAAEPAAVVAAPAAAAPMPPAVARAPVAARRAMAAAVDPVCGKRGRTYYRKHGWEYWRCNR